MKASKITLGLNTEQTSFNNTAVGRLNPAQLTPKLVHDTQRSNSPISRDPLKDNQISIRIPFETDDRKDTFEMNAGAESKKVIPEERTPGEAKGKQSMSSRTYEYLKPTSKMRLNENTLRSVLRNNRPPLAGDGDGSSPVPLTHMPLSQLNAQFPSSQFSPAVGRRDLDHEISNGTPGGRPGAISGLAAKHNKHKGTGFNPHSVLEANGPMGITGQKIKEKQKTSFGINTSNDLPTMNVTLDAESMIGRDSYNFERDQAAQMFKQKISDVVRQSKRGKYNGFGDSENFEGTMLINNDTQTKFAAAAAAAKDREEEEMVATGFTNYEAPYQPDVNHSLSELREHRIRMYQKKLQNLRNMVRKNAQSSSNILEHNNLAFRRIISPGSSKANIKNKEYQISSDVKERILMQRLGYNPEDFIDIEQRVGQNFQFGLPNNHTGSQMVSRNKLQQPRSTAANTIMPHDVSFQNLHNDPADSFYLTNVQPSLETLKSNPRAPPKLNSKLFTGLVEQLNRPGRLSPQSNQRGDGPLGSQVQSSPSGIFTRGVNTNNLNIQSTTTLNHPQSVKVGVLSPQSGSPLGSKRPMTFSRRGSEQKPTVQTTKSRKSRKSRTGDNFDTGSSQSKVFKEAHILYVFEDNQYIKTQETPCFKLDLTVLLKKYFMYNENLPQSQQTMTPEEMLNTQIRFYDRAINELIEEASTHIYKTKIKTGMMSKRTKKVDHAYVFLLDGRRVANLLDISSDSAVLIISEKPKFQGVEFEDPLKVKHSKEARVATMVRLKSEAFANTEVKPTAMANDQARFFPAKLPVGARSKVAPNGQTKQFVSQTLPTVGGGSNQPKLQVKLPQILSLRQQLQRQEQEEVAFLREAEASFLTEARAELGETFYQQYQEQNQAAQADEEEDRPLNGDETAENLMSQAIVKRKEWGKKYNLSDAVLFDLFSEFSGMMMIGKADITARKEQQQLKGAFRVTTPATIATPASGTSAAEEAALAKRMKELLPFTHNVKMSVASKHMDKGQGHKLEPSDLEDFRVPVKTFKEYSSVMKGLNQECQNSFLSAMGIDISYAKCKVSWEQFISIYCLLKLGAATPQDYIDFMCKVMDPFNAGKVPQEQFEKTLHSLFKGQFVLQGEDDENNMSADIRRDLAEKGLVTSLGQLDIEKFRAGLESGLVDINIFKSVMK